MFELNEADKAIIKIISTLNDELIDFSNYKTIYFRFVRSNNWLKMHGYPMRRRNVKVR